MTDSFDEIKETMKNKNDRAIDHLKAIAIEATHDGIALLDKEGTYYYLNEAHIRIFGYESESDLKGKTWRAIYGPEEIERIETKLFPQLMADGAWSGVTVGRMKDGAPIYQHITLTTLSDGGLICITRSINEERELALRLESSNRQLSNIVASINNGIILETAERRLVTINQTLVDMFGLEVDPTQAVGMSCIDAMQIVKGNVKDPEGFIALTEDLVRLAQTAFGNPVSLKNGRELIRDFIPVHNGAQLEGFLWVYRDITDQVRRADELERLVEKERELNSLKSKFLHTVTHEFKRPVLNTLEGVSLIKMLLQDQPGAEPIQRNLDFLVQELEKLNRHVNRLVSYETLLARKSLNLRPVLVKNLISNFLNYHYRMFIMSEKFIIQDETSDQFIEADMSMFDIVLRNLVENSVKYSYANDQVIITSSLSLDQRMVIMIFDNTLKNGHLPKQDYLGQPLYRGELNDDNGLGLGLGIVENIVALHGGHTAFKVGQGRFQVTIELPVTNTAL